ncbi:MAG: hypothetical protein RML94_00950 [Bacteroidia bacterium]|nr:hypothetical protein [Bacteroidia bacterium]
MGVSLRSCPQGRRAAGCAIASVLRTVLTHALRMPHARCQYANPNYSNLYLIST